MIVKKRILIVDDEEHIVELLVDFLQEHFELLTASNVVEAQKQLKNNSVDLIITDLVMPGGSGKELIGTRSSTNSNLIPVLVMSGLPEANVETSSTCLFIGKPFHIQVFFNKIEELLS
jgi:DNA-binding response OmpR family regulator